MPFLKLSPHPKQCLFLVFVLIVTGASSSYGGCIRTSSLELKRLLWELRQHETPRLARLAFLAQNFTDYKYGITDAACNPNCDSPVILVMKDMNLSSLTNASRSDTLELYRRVFSSFKEQIAKSMAKLSRAKKQPVAPKDLSSLQGIVDEMKNRLSRAVAVDRKLNCLPPLNTAATQQASPTLMSNLTTLGILPTPSITTVACHFSRCVLYTIREESYEMILRLPNIINNL